MHKVKYYPNGKKWVEKWVNENGYRHRENDLPAEIFYHPNGKIYSEEWVNEYGNEHRDNDLPAYIHYDENGNIQLKIWYNNCLRHRYYGPAQINYEEKTFKWFINGENKTEEILQYIKDHKIKTNEKGELVNKQDIMLFKLLWC